MPDMKLKKPHTHAGRKYPAGAVIRALRADQADWLEALGVAEPIAAADAPRAEPPAPRATPKPRAKE